ncbi:DUF1488 family protein [Paraglaciecola hydrolytica]|uniref:DUF1488 domain-containing protein n=1 Tax=Paraglaciecola hydrolytica TaxID=1799789 RepID=A0A136A457_9ALTE|nr:DUF1488 family protein [Paraglaciecola hydrolytica]KXI30004.1 hypothetical protein AX660_08340 [Paraglaciecola hydrolytica]
MNQAIQILDGAVYKEDKQSLEIQALNSGQLIYCYINGADTKTLLSLYANHQFNIEELLETLIENEQMDNEGQIHLHIDQFT